MLEELHPVALRIAALLRQRGEKVAVIDGATGGLISAALLTVPGALEFYTGGGVVYSLKGRETLLGMKQAELAGYRSVTEPYALLQARQVAQTFGAEWGIAETGSVGGRPHPMGVEAGRSCVAVAGPGFERAWLTETESDARIPNMVAFTRAALAALEEALVAAG